VLGVFGGGGIDTIKSLCVVAGLPMMFIYMILVKQLMMQLKGVNQIEALEQYESINSEMVKVN